MTKESDRRDWIKKHGITIGKATQFTFPNAEVVLPSFLEPPQKPLPNFPEMLEMRTGPFRADLLGWRWRQKARGIVVAELKMGKACGDDVLQLLSYMNYLKWLARRLPDVNLRELRQRIQYPDLRASTRVTGILVARDFDYNLWWALPQSRSMELLLVRHDIVRQTQGKAVGIKEVRFLDYKRKMRDHWSKP